MGISPPMAMPIVLAAADLTERSGALAFEVGYADALNLWYAEAKYGDMGSLTQFGATPQGAAWQLCIRILTGAQCACGRVVALQGPYDPTEQCLWTLKGDKWQRPCDAPSIDVEKRDISMKADLDRARQELNRRKRKWKR